MHLGFYSHILEVVKKLGFCLFFLGSLYSDATRFLTGLEMNFGPVNAVNILGIIIFLHS